MPWNEIPLFAVWITAAILAGGFARTRNRSAWTWFLLTTLSGPLAAYLLVTWPAKENSRVPENQTKVDEVRMMKVDDVA